MILSSTISFLKYFLVVILSSTISFYKVFSHFGSDIVFKAFHFEDFSHYNGDIVLNHCFELFSHFGADIVFVHSVLKYFLILVVIFCFIRELFTLVVIFTCHDLSIRTG